MGDFLTFRRFITPIIIQILFWLGVVGCIIGGIIFIATMGKMMGAMGIIYGLLIIILGPIVVRVDCELLIILFRINDNLIDIRNNTTKTM